MNGSIAKSESTDINSKLLRLRTQIYKPYKSVLSTDNQEQQSFMEQNKNYSLQLKQKNQFHDNLFQGGLKRKKTMKLPSILKKKKSIDSLVDGILPLATAADFVADPFLNGRIRNQREQLFASLDQNHNQYKFLRKVEELELQFLQNCSLKRYKQSEQVIVRLLNIAIDLNLIDELAHSIMILADFHFECLQNQKAFFFYNQSRKCGMLIGQHKLMSQSLIKMARCANRTNLHHEAIRILKKALQYIWFYDLTSLELTVYDQIGKAYYQMGDAQKAQCFHYKFFTGSIESDTSSIKLLSKQSLILEGLNQKKNIRNVSTVFLWMIHIPIRTCQQIQQHIEQDNEGQVSPRKYYEKDMKYFQQFRSVNQALIKLFADPFFKSELGQMNFKSADWTAPIRKKKFLSYDIKRNNHLKSLGIPYQEYFTKARANKIKKQDVIRKVKTEADEPEQNNDHNKKDKQQSQSKKVDDWLAFITLQTVKKYRLNNTEMSKKVNIRGIDKHSQPKVSSFRLLFNQYFDLAASHGAV